MFATPQQLLQPASTASSARPLPDAATQPSRHVILFGRHISSYTLPARLLCGGDLLGRRVEVLRLVAGHVASLAGTQILQEGVLKLIFLGACELEHLLAVAEEVKRRAAPNLEDVPAQCDHLLVLVAVDPEEARVLEALREGVVLGLKGAAGLAVREAHLQHDEPPAGRLLLERIGVLSKGVHERHVRGDHGFVPKHLELIKADFARAVDVHLEHKVLHLIRRHLDANEIDGVRDLVDVQLPVAVLVKQRKDILDVVVAHGCGAHRLALADRGAQGGEVRAEPQLLFRAKGSALDAANRAQLTLVERRL
mmetsp:Transcript_7196/g.18481  ORF Transcript_7196/g.18481 Transcript_7196/m.18481 type:complete len:309 (+) Transcript_7196:103-1029(+)